MRNRHPTPPTARRNVCGLPVLLCALALASAASAETSVSRFGVTWTFDRDCVVGVYANGDPWVVGPVTFTAISPATALVGGRQINGTMIDPVSGILGLKPGVVHGWDSDIQNSVYSAAANIARTLPVTIPAGASVMSAISVANPDPGDGHAARLDSISVLTVVAAAPAAGSFRPPYQAGDKTHRWNEANLDYGLLLNLPPVSGAPSLASVTATFARTWIETDTNTGGRYLHPASTQPPYGRDLSAAAQDALLSLHLNYTRAQKRDLFVRLVQYGIDVYGCARGGGDWFPAGGFNMGRKMPMVLAGLALNDPEILAYADAATHLIFQEDAGTFHVSQADVDRPRYTGDGRPRAPYTAAMIGTAEWGEQHTYSPGRDAANWDAYYRDINFYALVGHHLMARLTPGARPAWNWPAFFDYHDRAFALSAAQMPVFSRNMVTAYRALADDPHALWKLSCFGASATDPAVSGDTADPDGDRIANLVEFALGSDPTSSSPGSAPQFVATGAVRQLRFTRRAFVDATLVVESSADLAQWTTVATLPANSSTWSGPATVQETGGGATRETVVAETFAPGQPRGFLRLNTMRP